ncbi:MAG: PEP-CTERM sorting domain-containing protein [Gammaproteobacteria bacterium]|nr:PEP-CTERM sorting domain-containing protein [Gammaproteobacteria bacterium]
MINKKQLFMLAGLTLSIVATPVNALLISVSGPLSSKGVAASIISAPTSVADDGHVNNAMQGFDEAQDVTTSKNFVIDGGALLKGKKVNSHMLFLNSGDDSYISHENVEWIFDGLILGIMSNKSGSKEAASNSEFGNVGTFYPGSFSARGLEGNDAYTILGDTLILSMFVSKPGDWIRVITRVPEPSIMWLLGSGLVFLGFARRKVKM